MVRLGAGAMSEVWVDPGQPDRVLKRIRADQQTNPVFLHQQRAEAEALTRVRHPAVIRLWAASPEGLWLERGVPAEPPPPDERLAAVDRLADALATAHDAGVVHRDVKAGNVLRVERGLVLADFGCARIDGWDDPAPLLGSPEAMSPWRLAGGPARPADDRWALAVLLWTWCAGTPPFPSRRFREVLALQGAGFPPPPASMSGAERDRVRAWTAGQ